ncbi:MAG: hypothetical protein AAF650_08435 [Pseudomonadota bacterium]
MTKHKGLAASYAPEIGLPVPLLRSAAGGCAGVLLANHTLAISLAPAALLMSSTSAIAQDACVEVDPNTFECVDNGAPATTTQVVTGSDVSVDIQDGFDIDATGDGIDVTTTGGVTITSSGSMNSITSGGRGVVVDNSVAGDLILDITPSVINVATFGVLARNDGDGLTSVTTGSIEAAGILGIYVIGEAGTSDLTIDTSAGRVEGNNFGVSATNYGSGVTRITTGDIVMPAGIGLAANHQGTDLIVDTTGGTIDASATAVSVSNSGTGYTRVTTGDLTGVLFVSHRGSSAEIDTRAGTASAGIVVQNAGTGPLSLITGNVGNPSNNGIYVNNQPGSAGPVTIDTSAGAVNAAAAGIDVRGTGTGALSITTANVDAGTGAGVYARTYGASVTIDTSAGAVSSASGYGLRAITFSPGQTDIVTGDVSGGLSAAGINAIGGTGVSFDSTGGTLTGGAFGVFVRNYGAGDAYVATADVYGNGGDAIFVDTGTDAGDIFVNSAAGVAIGSADGVEVTNRGTGAVSVTTGDVTGGSDIGIDLYNQSGTDITLDSSAGAVSGARFGVYTRNDGTGDVSVTTGDVTAAGAVSLSAVRVRNRSEGLVTVDTSAGSISGDQEGVGISQLAAGAVSLTTGDVSASGGTAVSVSHSTMSGDYGAEDITINTSAGSVSGSLYGIYVRQPGTGNLSITTADVAGGTAGGIEARVSASSVTIDSSAGTVSGDNGGIGVDQQGAGTVSITSADVMSGVNGIGVSSAIDTGDIAVNSSAGAVTATQYGIIVSNGGTGSSTVVAADVNATNLAGIRVDNYNAASTGVLIDTSAGTIIGGTSGIRVRNDGAGDTQITVNDVTGQGGDGISAFTINNAGAGNVLIQGSSGDVIGASNGIYTRTAGTDITIDNLDSVTGQSGYGVYAASVGGAIVISDIGAISGTQNGILALSEGGDISVQNIGSIQAGGDPGDRGIMVDSRFGTGSGAINIGGVQAIGDVTGGDDGILAFADSTGDITINTTGGTVSGFNEGIEAQHEGTGSIAITTADVNAATFDGIFAETQASSGGITINTAAGTVTAERLGIFAIQQGTGALSITTADVSSNTSFGVYGGTRSVSTDLTIDTTAGAVMATQTAVDARHQGSGVLSIATGDVSSADYSGVYAANTTSGSSLSIDTSGGAVAGSREGIYARQYGAGSLSITTADVSSGSSEGIDARTDVGATDAAIDTTAGAVSGLTDGIIVNHDGSGSVTIATADVSGTNRIGVLAVNEGTDLSVDSRAGQVSGDSTGILVSDFGSGSATIRTADVVAYSGIAISAVFWETKADGLIDTTAGTVTGQDAGISSANLGSGRHDILTSDVTGVTGTGVLLTNFGTDLEVNTSAGSVTGGTEGLRIAQVGTGSTTITSADVTGQSGSAIAAFTGGTDLTIDTTAGTVSAQLRGVLAYHTGTGAIAIITGAVASAAGDGVIVSNVAGETATDVSVNTSGGQVAGYYDGVEVFNYGIGATSVITADVTATLDDAVYARSEGTTLTIDTSAGALSGTGQGIEAINNGTGATTITVNDVTGTGAEGIFAQNNTANTAITVRGSSGDVTGATDGVYLRTAGGDITVETLDSVTGQAGHGLDLTNAGVSLTVSDIGTITGTGGIGVLADTSNGAVSIQGVGLVGGVTGTGDFGILATGASIDIGGLTAIGDVTGTVAGISATSTDPGDLVINTSAGAVSGGTNGVLVTAVGAGDLSVTTANISSDTGSALALSNSALSGDIAINTSAGSVSGGTFGVAVENLGTGSTTITTADVTGASASGIIAVNQASALDLSIDTSLGAVTGSIDGVEATNLGTGALVILTGDVTGTSDDGVMAFNSAAGTDLSLDTSAGAVTAADLGLSAANEGSGATMIVTAEVTSANVGISAINSAQATSLAVNSAAGAVVGDAFGVLVSHDGSGAASVTTADVTSADGTAIYAVSSSGDITVDSSGGSLAAGERAIEVQSLGAGAINVLTADATSTNDLAIMAYSLGGDITVNTALGDVTGTNAGIAAMQLGTGDLSITTADVTASAGNAVHAVSGAEAGATAIDASAGVLMGGANGVYAQHQGAGDLSITALGAVGGTNGVLTNQTLGGAQSISLADATGLTNAGVSASTSGTGLTIAITGTVMGNEAGVIANNSGAGETTITSSGVVMATSGEAIRVSGASANVINDGLIVGFVTLGDGDDSFTNNGDFSASADSAFGGGANLFANNGLFAVASPGPIAFNGLSGFANTGTISLIDNTFGNGLTLSGDFNGSVGSALAIDLSFETGEADVLTIAGAATGSTLVEINLLGPVTSTTFDDILIVDAGTGSEAGAFSVAGGRQEIGLLRYEVAFDGAADDYFIVSVPTEEALQTSNFAEGARNLWGQSLDIWSNQLANLRGGNGAGNSSLGGGGEGSARAWFAANASEISRDRVETFTSNLLTTVVDLGYDQDFLGFQGGVDFGNDALRYGVTGGYLRSEYEFSSSSDRINYDVLNVGAYLTLDTGAFFANVLVKYDSIEGSIEGTSGLLDGDADGSTFGARGEIGTLLGDRSGLFAEPSASLSWIDADLDDISTAQGEFEFSEDSSLLGRFGARVGSGFASGKTTGIAYIGAHYVSEFQGDDGVAFISSGRAETFAARPFDDFVEARAGVSLGSDEASWSGGVEGHVLFGDDLDGFGVSANIQYRF